MLTFIILSMFKTHEWLRLDMVLQLITNDFVINVTKISTTELCMEL